MTHILNWLNGRISAAEGKPVRTWLWQTAAAFTQAIVLPFMWLPEIREEPKERLEIAGLLAGIGMLWLGAFGMLLHPLLLLYQKFLWPHLAGKAYFESEMRDLAAQLDSLPPRRQEPGYDFLDDDDDDSMAIACWLDSIHFIKYPPHVQALWNLFKSKCPRAAQKYREGYPLAHNKLRIEP